MTVPYPHKCTAYHEAGHLVLAHLEGFQTGNIKVLPNGNGHAVTFPLLPGASPLNYANKRIGVLLAGAVAQCIVLNNGDKECARAALETGNANNDWKRVDELSRIVAQSRCPATVTEDAFAAETTLVIDEHMRETQRLLELNLPALKAIGQLVIEQFDLILGDPDLDGVVDATAIHPLLTSLTR